MERKYCEKKEEPNFKNNRLDLPGKCLGQMIEALGPTCRFNLQQWYWDVFWGAPMLVLCHQLFLFTFYRITYLYLYQVHV